MQLWSVFLATALAGVAIAAPADAAVEAVSVVGRDLAALHSDMVVKRSDYHTCWRRCRGGCAGSPNVCDPACIVACINAGETEDSKREVTDGLGPVARRDLAVRHSDMMAKRSDYHACWRRCRGGCAGSPNVCDPACIVACINAGESEEAKREIEAETVQKRDAVMATSESLSKRNDYETCYRQCMSGCFGRAEVCSPSCMVTCYVQFPDTAPFSNKHAEVEAAPAVNGTETA